MCKVMILTGIKDSDAAMDFMKDAEPEMTKGNTDGIGYSAINSKNELFMEKWHRNYHFLNTEKVLDGETLKALEPYKAKLPALEQNYMSYGEITRDDLRTVTMHTRMATCGRTMENTHPFVDKGVSLIHNGVISNAYDLKLNKISTCDSEVALQLFIKEDISNVSKSGYQAFLDQLKGYWAFGILAKNKDDKYILDVVREGASLYFAYIPELGDDKQPATVFATTREIISAACKTCGFDVPEIVGLKEFCLSRFDAVSGELLASVDVKKSQANEWKYEKSYTKYWNNDKKDDAQIEFLNRKAKRKEVELITQSAEATISGELTSDEYEIFEAKDRNLTESLRIYDDFLGSNYVIFIDSMPPMMIERIEKLYATGKINFKNVLDIIEEFNNFNMQKTWSMIHKLASGN